MKIKYVKSEKIVKVDLKNSGDFIFIINVDGKIYSQDAFGKWREVIIINCQKAKY